MAQAKMTRAHFQGIADTLRAQRPASLTRPAAAGAKARLVAAVHAEAWRSVVEAFADLCAQSNPGFQRARFLHACGVEDERVRV